jgi:hypothetical protein
MSPEGATLNLESNWTQARAMLAVVLCTAHSSVTKAYIRGAVLMLQHPKLCIIAGHQLA